MENKKDKIFVDGLGFKKPRENAPDFVKGNISINVPRLQAFLETHGKGKEWLNCDLKKSQGGKLYIELNVWEKPASLDKPKSTIEADDIPFE